VSVHVFILKENIKINSHVCRIYLHDGYIVKRVRYEVLTAANIKMAVFWVVAQCSLVEIYRRFRGAYCLRHQGDE
jgi:hypothetical protein